MDKIDVWAPWASAILAGSGIFLLLADEAFWLGGGLLLAVGAVGAIGYAAIKLHKHEAGKETTSGVSWVMDSRKVKKEKDGMTAIYVGVSGLVLLFGGFVAFDMDIMIGGEHIWWMLVACGLGMLTAGKGMAEKANPQIKKQNTSFLTGLIKILLLIVLLVVVCWMLVSCLPGIMLLGAMAS